MPIYRYSCPKCGEEKRLMRRASDADQLVACQACSQALPDFAMVRRVGSPSARAVETGDEYHGLKAVQGVKEMVGERATDHFRRHELPRIVEKEGRQAAEERGLLDSEGNPKV